MARQTRLAWALGICLASASLVSAQNNPPRQLDLGSHAEANRVVSANQALANALAQRLESSGVLHGYRVTLTVRNGVVELTGTVASAGQRQQAELLVRAQPGVVRVVNRLTLPPSQDVRQAQVLQPTPSEGSGGNAPELPPPPAAGPQASQPAPIFQAQPGAKPRLPEPTPIFQAQPGANPHYPPRMPPYAWPTYAPYNNYSRVAYPTIYPYKSFPFIGPFYPFPKIPLGWRSVTLTWQDGFWWYGRNATGRHWWQVRFW